MKILLVNKFFYLKGGAEAHFFDTAKLFERKGHEPIFFSMKHPNNFSSKHRTYFVSNIDYEKHGIKTNITASLKLLYSFEAKGKIEQLIIDQKPDLVHLNNIYHQLSPSILHAIKKHDLPIVMSLHDHKMVCPSYLLFFNKKICEACRGGRYYHCFLKGCVKNSRSKSLLNTIEMYLHHRILHIYHLVDVFISPSRALQFNLKRLGFKGNIVYLPNFINIDEFEAQFTFRENAIVYFGRLSREKGLDALIEAVKDIKDVNLKIIGEGPKKQDLEKKAKQGKYRNVRFLGYKTGEELKREIKESMFTILPSECYENNPLSIIEAFALGKPAVGARIGGIPELVRDGETGMTFEPGNIDDLRETLLVMLKNPDKLFQMGKNARDMVEKKYNAESHYDNLMNIYESLLI
jgi:glycosyltransferase involved in cell wall biosynthesis